MSMQAGLMWILLSVVHLRNPPCPLVHKQWVMSRMRVCALNVVAVQVVAVLKKEIVKTQNKDLEKGAEYRQLLVQAIHSCAVKFPDVAGGPPLLSTNLHMACVL